MDGLTMKNGREINNRPDSETGIAKLARIRREMKRAEKVTIIAEGNDLAESRKVILKKFK
tara:strand:+ start:58 stop:237 length:180 start_codon:yes stop_codon:yes gene_type:complete